MLTDNKYQTFIAFVVAFSIGVLVFCQGGYYNLVTCITSLVCCTVAVVSCFIIKQFRFSLSSILFCILGLLCLLSMAVNGFVLTSMLHTSWIFSIIGIALLLSFLDINGKKLTLKIVSVIGVFSALFGIALFFGFMPMEGTVNAGRLMFTFQYANVAGIWFAVIAVLCWTSNNWKFRVASILPVIALGMTQSIGAIALFGIAVVILAIKWFKFEKHEKTFNIVAIVILVIISVIIIVLSGLFRPRIFQASQTLIERLIQILDGGMLLLTHPFGIGPDMWQFLYPFAQTAQYSATRIHCSVLQQGLDGGWIAVICVIAYFVICFVKAYKSKDFVTIICGGLLVAHCFVDFDMSFSAIVILMILLLDPLELELFNKLEKKKSIVIVLILVMFSVVGSICGIVFDQQMSQEDKVYELTQKGVIPKSINELPAYLANDPKIIAIYTGSLSMTNKKSEITERKEEPKSASEALYKALAFARSNKKTEAANIIIEEMYREPYNLAYMEEAIGFLKAIGLNKEIVNKYNDAVKYANSLIHQGHASWLNNQEELELL